MQKKHKIAIIISIPFILAFVFASIKLYPLIKEINLLEFEKKLEIFIKNSGWKGLFIFLFLQILQVFIAFIPGEIIEIAGGALYGPLLGTVLCLLGLILGTIAIYYSLIYITKNNAQKYQQKLSTYSFLNNPKKIHLYFFILFIIPGIPKDIFIYLVPFLPIKLSSFIAVSTIARIPSIISSTFIGSSLISGNYITSIVIFSIFLILGIIAILFHDKILNLFTRKNKERINKENNIEN